MKKTLSLVLVLCMVFSFFGFAGAAFKDDADIQYKEAVGVMTGIGAINGMGDNTFAPKGDITRAQAAKLVAYAILSADVAKMLPAKASSFTDVDANFAWAIPSIEYLVDKGVINGRGDGTFDPNGKVTAFEMGKMLLVANGFGKNGEYTGNSWALNVAIDARKNGIFDNTKAADLSAPATREEAALYAFNGINYSAAGTTVKYNVVKNNAVISTWDSFIEAYLVADKTEGATVETVKVATGSIGSNVYGLKKTTSSQNDAGYAGYYWDTAASIKAGTHITEFVITDTVVGTFGAGTTYKALATALGVTATSTKTIQYYGNGVAEGSAVEAKTLLNDTTNVIPAGVTVTLAVDTDGNYKALATIEYLAKVKSVTALTGTDKGLDSVVFTVFSKGVEYDVTLGAAAKIANGTYKKDAMYIVVPHGDHSNAAKFLSIKAVETVDGKVTGQGAGYVRVDGNKLYLGVAPKAVDGLNYTDVFTFFLDSTGAVAGYAKKTTVASTDYLYLMNIAADFTAANPIFGGNTVDTAVIKAQVAFPDGKVELVDLGVFAPAAGAAVTSYYKTNGTVGAITADGAVAGVAAGAFYGYKVTDGKYTLTDVSGATTGTLTFAKNNASITGIDNKYATSATEVTVITYNTVTKTLSTTNYKGIANFPSKTFTNVSYMASFNSSNSAIIESVFMFESTTPVTTSNFAVYVKQGEQYDVNKYYQGFYVNGEYVEYKVDAGITVGSAADNTLEAGKAYTLTLDATNKATAATYVAYATTAAKVTAVDATYLMTNGAPVYFAEGAVCFNIDANHKGEADKIEIGDTVVYILGSGANSGKIVAAFITVDVND